MAVLRGCDVSSQIVDRNPWPGPDTRHDGRGQNKRGTHPDRKIRRIVLEADAMGLLASAVETGAAVGLMMEAATPACANFKSLPITENKGYHFTLSACWRKDMTLSVAARALVDFLTIDDANIL